MSNKPVPSVVLFVSDVPRLSTFYRELASMTIVHQEASHAILEIEGFQLVIHALHGEPSPQPSSDGQLSVRDDSYFKLCLPVESLDAARSQAASLGGFIKAREHEWEARGFRACDGHDPEGNVLQVRLNVV